MTRWTNKEKQILKDNYYIIPGIELLKLLPGRTSKEIRNQVYYLRKQGWRFSKPPKGAK